MADNGLAWSADSFRHHGVVHSDYLKDLLGRETRAIGVEFYNLAFSYCSFQEKFNIYLDNLFKLINMYKLKQKKETN
ncbi:MAG: hypothetical protein ACFFE4_18430 [Candidatus Thorarchaeota archaeon]